MGKSLFLHKTLVEQPQGNGISHYEFIHYLDNFEVLDFGVGFF